MAAALLLTVSFFVGIIGNLFTKAKSNALKTDTLLRYALYFIVNGVIGALFFWISGGFSLLTDWRTLFFGATCALCVGVMLVCNVHIFRIASVAAVHVLLSAGTLVTSALYGPLLFDEAIDGRRLLRIALMLLAAYFIFLDRGGRIRFRKRAEASEESTPRPRNTVLLIALLLAEILASVGNSIAVRYYMRMSENPSSHSLYCYTNVFLVILAVPVFVVVALRHREEVRPSMETLRPLMLFLIGGATITSNVSSWIQAELVLQMDATVLTPISAAITNLAAFATSFAVLRERAGKYAFLAAGLALLTVLLM